MRVMLRGRRSIWWSWSVTFRGRHSNWWIWVDRRSGKSCNFQYKMRLPSAKSNHGERAGARWLVHVRIMLGSWSDHAEVMLKSAARCKWCFNCFRQISVTFWSAILRGRRSIWWRWRASPVAARIWHLQVMSSCIHPTSRICGVPSGLVGMQPVDLCLGDDRSHDGLMSGFGEDLVDRSRSCA